MSKRLLLLLLLIGACRGDAPAPAEPERPPDEAGEAPRFEEYFAELVLEDADTGARGLYDAQNGWRFSRKARLRVAYTALRPAALRLVAESRTSGVTAGVWSRTVSTGSDVVPIGSFPRDLYLLHVFVGGARIATLPFASE